MQHPGGHGGGGKGHGAKHSRHKKHVQGKGKHHPKHQPQGHHKSQPGFVHTVAAHHPHHPRGLAVGDFLPVCTFDALAQSLRLAGQRVSEDDALGLWDLCGQREVSIAEALAAAARFGLAGCRPADFATIDLDRASGECMRLWRRGLSEELDSSAEGERSPGSIPGPDICAGSSVAECSLSDCLVILGVDLPGPHAVLATPDGWWSWGSLHAPWTTAVSEAWAVSWS